MENKIKFGDIVSFDEKTYAKRDYTGYRNWEIEKLNKKEIGICIGFRNVYEGFPDAGEFGKFFVREKTVKTALIVVKNRNPIYVPIDNIKLVKKGGFDEK